MIKLFNDICEIAVLLSVHTIYGYVGHCCICRGENIQISFMIILDFQVNYILLFFQLAHFYKFTVC
jgi:hypothetical protein